MSASDHLRCVDETITPESSPLQENSGSCRTRPLAAQKRRLSIILDDETYGSQGPSTVSSQYDADNDGPRCALCIPPMSSCKDNSLNVCLDCLRSSSTPAKRARSDTDEPSLPSSGSIEPIFSLVVDEVDPALTQYCFSFSFFFFFLPWSNYYSGIVQLQWMTRSRSDFA